VPKKVTITIMDKPSAPSSSPNPFMLCETSAHQVAWVSGINVQWYTDQPLTNLISKENSLQIPVADATYYVTQTIDNCESDPLILKVVVNKINAEIYADGVNILTLEEDADSYEWYRNGDFWSYTSVPKIPFDGQVATYEVLIRKGYCYERSAPFVSSPDNITSVEEAPESVLSIYPNPTSSMVTLKTSKVIASIIILDAMGKRVYSAPHNNPIGKTLDVSRWAKGVYTIIIDDGKQLYTKRMVVL
jgi:hypothetical protein